MSIKTAFGLVYLAFLTLALAGGNKPKCTFRLHVQTTGDKLSVNQAMPAFLNDPPETIQVSTIPDLSERDLVKAEARETTNGRTLWVKFDNHGTTVLSTITTQFMGRIFVVYLNQKVIFSPVIDQRIGNGELIVPYPVTDEEIKALNKVIKKNDKQ
jgi:preprotein translocase subunit SecD